MLRRRDLVGPGPLSIFVFIAGPSRWRGFLLTLCIILLNLFFKQVFWTLDAATEFRTGDPGQHECTCEQKRDRNDEPRNHGLAPVPPPPA